MSFKKFFFILATTVLLVACGGGGGNPGTSSGGSGTGGTGGSGGGSTTPATASMKIDLISASGLSSTTISAVEITTAKATVLDKTGAPVPGIIVTFAEAGPGLLTFAPTARTALTDSSGTASVEVRAQTATSVGATVVTAAATVAAEGVTVQKAIQVTSAPQTPGIDPQSLVNSISFLDSNPADKSIVLAGAGGSNRAESATLRFRVVDKNNTAVKGVLVSFSLQAPVPVKLNIMSATSDADGTVVTTVSSGTQPTAVVVLAKVTKADSSVIVSQSDTLSVTTGISTQAGFDLSSTKYFLNYGLSGDSTSITVRIVDRFGNPVADGVPVVFTADFGAVGTSSRGGCVTLNGACNVAFTVQNPRPLDGFATVTGSTLLGDGTPISGTLQIGISRLDLISLYNGSGVIVNSVDMPTGSCKSTFSLFAGTPNGLQPPTGSSISATAVTSDMTTTIKSGAAIVDVRPFGRAPFDIEVDLTSLKSGVCSSTGVTPLSATLSIKVTSGAFSTAPLILTVNYKGV